MFKVGDRVLSTMGVTKGLVGTVEIVKKGHTGVRFDGWSGHNFGGKAGPGPNNGWWTSQDNLEKVSPMHLKDPLFSLEEIHEWASK
jgi:hypothetical protein